MFFTRKAYLNARGGPAVLVLTHDVKRCLDESKARKGQINILSTQGTTSVTLMENDRELQREYLQYIQGQFQGASRQGLSRRSRTGANCYHHMAAMVGLSLTLAFENGRLLMSPFHEILALDFEPRAGRREFVLTLLGE